MKTAKGILYIITAFVIVSCKKETEETTPQVTVNGYTSVTDFLSKNTPVMQTYTISGVSGGSITSPQGTIINIPANAFLTQAGIPVTGVVTIQFKDIYKKSDMVLADMSTMTNFSSPLKSCGEFFIKALSNNSALILDAGKRITVSQPGALTGGLDSINVMQAFIQQDTLGQFGGWSPAPADSVFYSASNYIFSLYQFNAPVDTGSWCNSDNSTYFSAYPQTTLTLMPNDNVNSYGTEVFLVFKNISSMVHVYYEQFSSKFPYYYAPQGLQCTLVAIGVKNGVVYSSFNPITITANQSVNFTLSPTTTSAFITQLNALN